MKHIEISILLALSCHKQSRIKWTRYKSAALRFYPAI